MADKITWDVEVLEDGWFEVELYYTCSEENVGGTIELYLEENRLQTKILEAYDPPLIGMEHDRILRTQFYVKDFKKMEMGKIRLLKGKGELTLKAIEIPGNFVMDFRLLMIRRI